MRHLRFALLASGLIAAAGFATARADHGCGEPCSTPCPTTRTICVKEWVPEQYETTRTTYKRETREETYTAYRTETVQEQRTRNVTVYKKVPEIQTITKKVCVKVPCVEERTCWETKVSYVPETKVVRKCVDKGHWECKEVPCEPKHHPLKGLFHKHDCCEPCEECPKMKTIKVWVPCPTWEEHTVSCCRKVCEKVAVVKQVHTCKTEWREETCQVTVCKCVPETHVETYCVNVCKQVPCQAKRCVTVCVPCVEKVTCCRMVCRTVTKEVPVCETTCCSEGGHKLSGLFHRCKKSHDCCEVSCGCH